MHGIRKKPFSMSHQNIKHQTPSINALPTATPSIYTTAVPVCILNIVDTITVVDYLIFLKTTLQIQNTPTQHDERLYFFSFSFHLFIGSCLSARPVCRHDCHSKFAAIRGGKELWSRS
jgi:hypothetical protein